jgi:hypothetical protein
MHMRNNWLKMMSILGALVAIIIGGHEVRAEAVDDVRQGTGVEHHRLPPDLTMPPPDEMVTDRSKQLGLTNDQQTKINAIITADRDKHESLMQKIREYRQQLRSATLALKFDEPAVRAIAMKQAQVEIELNVSRARGQSRIYALLTPEQRVLMAKRPPPDLRKRVSGPECCCERKPGYFPPPPPRDDDHLPGTGAGRTNEPE